jgi:hypothetical protein
LHECQLFWFILWTINSCQSPEAVIHSSFDGG